jgi:hypothetical protein
MNNFSQNLIATAMFFSQTEGQRSQHAQQEELSFPRLRLGSARRASFVRRLSREVPAVPSELCRARVATPEVRIGVQYDTNNVSNVREEGWMSSIELGFQSWIPFQQSTLLRPTVSSRQHG